MHYRSLLVLSFIGLLLGAVPLWAQSPPNIVVVVADDLGYADVGFHGSDIRTPAIDRLAENGARMERFYALPFCTPTRASLMTGRYPFRYGLQTAAIPADGEYGLDTDEYLLPQALKSAGYTTAIVGKWHLGHFDETYWPTNRGFDYQYGPLKGEIDYFTHSTKGERDWYEDGVVKKETGYATNLLGDKAEQVIMEHDTGTPLFLYLAFTAPHAPYQVLPEYEEPYASIDDPTRRAYAGMVTCMDRQIDRVLSALERKGMRDNTLIVFMSDNGGNRTSMFSGESDVSDLTLPASNAPFRGGKGMLTEGGTRVVAVANWPGHIPAGTVSAPIHVVDLFPTIAHAADLPVKSVKPPDGVDQWKLLTTGGRPVRDEVVYNIEPYRAVLSRGKWKLMLKFAIPPHAELYDVEADPSEESNVAEQHAELVAEMRSRIIALSKEATPPLFLGYALKHSDQLEKFIRPMIPEQ